MPNREEEDLMYTLVDIYETALKKIEQLECKCSLPKGKAWIRGGLCYSCIAWSALNRAKEIGG